MLQAHDFVAQEVYSDDEAIHYTLYNVTCDVVLYLHCVMKLFTIHCTM